MSPYPVSHAHLVGGRLFPLLETALCCSASAPSMLPLREFLGFVHVLFHLLLLLENLVLACAAELARLRLAPPCSSIELSSMTARTGRRPHRLWEVVVAPAGVG